VLPSLFFYMKDMEFQIPKKEWRVQESLKMKILVIPN
jgi:hypothetical protein